MATGASPTSLAQAVVAGDWQHVVADCRRDSQLAQAVSEAVAVVVVDEAASHSIALPPAEAVWPRAQHGIVELARVPGANQRRLAEALLEVCTLETVTTSGDDLTQDALRLLIDQAPDLVGALVDNPDRYGQLPPPPWKYHGTTTAFLFRALWMLPGEGGVNWFLRMFPHHDIKMNFLYQDMRVEKYAAWTRFEWTAEDWALRLHALADARLDPPPGLLTVFGLGRTPPPRESSAAQVHLACVYGTRPEDYIVRTVAANVKSYRTGNPREDVDLFWWPPPAEDQTLMRALIELAGEPGEREPLIRAAAEAGVIDEAGARKLGAPLARPEWADREVPWSVDEVVEAGTVRTPDGRIAAGDPWIASEQMPFVVLVAPGAYPVRVAVAAHPVYGRGNGAAELLIEADAEPDRWELVETTHPSASGYVVEVGVGSFGSEEALDSGVVPLLPDDIDYRTEVREIDRGDVGSLVMFAVVPQHQDCRTWAGLTSDGRVVRLLTDLGLLDLDPSESPPDW